ncbi:calpastatin [Modestobacter sp. VKM Ac-2676]|nr:calpastatin [Modestobacter sp. VKM Ac-2676]
MSPDPFDLQRFVAAQDSGGTYPQALAELRAGAKRSHWMWFVFPQVAGLGRSPMAQRYAVGGAEEARAYLAHPVLGPRLVECAEALLDLGTSDPVAVLGGVDAQKLRSSITLFAAVAEQPAFGAVLDRFFAGHRDDATLTRL